MLNIVFIEMTHVIARGAALHGGSIEQRGIGEDHATRVHGDISRQPIQAFNEVEEMVEEASANADREG